MTRRVLVTGGCGFLGSHTAEHLAAAGNDVVVLDNLSRASLMGMDGTSLLHNHRFLEDRENVRIIDGDVLNRDLVHELVSDCDAVLHFAGQSAVTCSIERPMEDFLVNATGAMVVLEGARLSPRRPMVLFASSNKVYGENINRLVSVERETRYELLPPHENGIAEDLRCDIAPHGPYGCSKLVGDLYAQEYARIYGLRTAVFRMSTVYGIRQFATVHQGWVAYMCLKALRGETITVFGDGKQVRDVLWVEDLARAVDLCLRSDLSHAVFNVGGGPSNTLSTLELLAILKEDLGLRFEFSLSSWRTADQKVYVSDIRKIGKALGWRPIVGFREGIERLVRWLEGYKGEAQWPT